MITPAFEVPDETAHFAYAQRLAESGIRAGDVGRSEFSSEQTQVMAAIGTLGIIGRPLTRAPADRSAGKAADEAIRFARDHASRTDGGGPSTASAQPSLYYAISAIPYRIFSSESLLVRLHAMRCASAVIFALGAALCALFVRELIPRHLAPALVGGLAIALSPYSAFIASGVTPDTLLLTASAGLLASLARASRRGVTLRRAACIGLCLGIGIMTKLTFLAFVPPGLVAFIALAWRDRDKRAEGLRPMLATFAAAAAVLPVIFVAWLALTGRDLRPTGTSTAVLASTAPENTRELLSYAWQLFLPRAPFLTDQFGFSPLKVTWLQGFAGRYGWLDYGATSTVNAVVSYASIAIGVLCAAFALSHRAALRRYWLEALFGLAFCCFLWAIIAKAGYDYHRTTGFVFEQPRYLFPVAAVYALAVSTASLGLGQRGVAYVATVLVGLFCLHDMSGVAFTLARYYG